MHSNVYTTRTQQNQNQLYTKKLDYIDNLCVCECVVDYNRLVQFCSGNVIVELKIESYRQ